jgi:F-type H+-transporting ATPase subunit gamma
MFAAKRAGDPDGPGEKRHKDSGVIGGVAGGSDEGLVGQFNEVVAAYAIKTLATLPDDLKVRAIGERVHARLADAGLPLMGLFPVPTSVQAIIPVVGRNLLESETHDSPGDETELHLFYNRPTSGVAYAPVSQRLLPLDENWRHKLAEVSWPTGNLFEVMVVAPRPCGHSSARFFFLTLPGVRGIPRE